MNEHVFIGGYWSARKESIHESARRTSSFLHSISEVQPFQRWYLKGLSRKRAQVPIGTTPETLENLLKTNKRDTDGSTIRELGFNLNIWNGSREEPAAFSVTCGSFSNFVVNSAVLYLPPQAPPIDTGTQERLQSLLMKLVHAWEPDDAVVTSSEFIERCGGGVPSEVGGWISYNRGRGVAVLH